MPAIRPLSVPSFHVQHGRPGVDYLTNFFLHLHVHGDLKQYYCGTCMLSLALAHPFVLHLMILCML